MHIVILFTCLLAERFGNAHAPTTTDDKKEQHPEEMVKTANCWSLNKL